MRIIAETNAAKIQMTGHENILETVLESMTES